MSAMENTHVAGSHEVVATPEWVSRVAVVEELLENGLSTWVPASLRCHDASCPIEEIHHAGPCRMDPRVPDQAHLPLAPWKVYGTLDLLEFLGEPFALPEENEIPDYALESRARLNKLIKDFDEVHSWSPAPARKGASRNGTGIARKGKKPERNWQAAVQNGPKALIIGSGKKAVAKQQPTRKEPELARPEPAAKFAESSSGMSVYSEPSDTTNTKLVWHEDVEESLQ
ncbi:MAG: hypothetical protein Q9201_005714 [Fulgogasparrea decipioides]